MQSTIIIPNVQISFAEFRQIQQHYLLRKRWWVVVLCALYPLYSIWLNDSGNSSTLAGKLGLTLFFVCILTGTVIYGVNSGLKRSFEKTPYFQYATTFQLDASGIQASNPIINSSANWNTVHKARQFGKWYVLTDKNQQGHLLDSSQIQYPATEADLQALLQQHGIVIQ